MWRMCQSCSNPTRLVSAAHCWPRSNSSEGSCSRLTVFFWHRFSPLNIVLYVVVKQCMTGVFYFELNFYFTQYMAKVWSHPLFLHILLWNFETGTAIVSNIHGKTAYKAKTEFVCLAPLSFSIVWTLSSSLSSLWGSSGIVLQASWMFLPLSFDWEQLIVVTLL